MEIFQPSPVLDLLRFKPQVAKRKLREYGDAWLENQRISAAEAQPSLESLVNQYQNELAKIMEAAQQKLPRESSKSSDDRYQFYEQGLCLTINAEDMKLDSLFEPNNKIYPAKIKFPSTNHEYDLVLINAEQLSDSIDNLHQLTQTYAFKKHYPNIYLISDSKWLMVEKLEGFDNENLYKNRFGDNYDQILKTYVDMIEDFSDEGYWLWDLDPFTCQNIFFNTKTNKFQLIDLGCFEYEPKLDKYELISKSLHILFLYMIKNSASNPNDYYIDGDYDEEQALALRRLLEDFIDKYPEQLRDKLSPAIQAIDIALEPTS